MARGEHLVRGDRGFATGGGMLARLFAPALSHVLDEVDRRLDHGGLDTILPCGGPPRLRFCSPRPAAGVQISSWIALLRPSTSRSGGWYKTWALGEWTSPHPVAVL